MKNNRHLQLLFKRIIDICVASVCFIVVLPIILIILGIILITMGRPAIYRQTRPGKDEKLFKLLKFRTMNYARDAQDHLLPDEKRLTALGLFLRKTSLDELPQLINVLKGDMSLVGPRPLLVRYLPRYNSRQRLRHSVKPGLTGWAQVNGRNALDWNAKLEMDVWYAENFNLWLDFKIFLLTFAKIFCWKEVKARAEFDDFWGSIGVPEHGPRALPVEENEIYQNH